MADKKYLVVYKGFNSIPSPLRAFVKARITQEFEPFDLELDFSGATTPRDLVVHLNGDVPLWSVFGESSRPTINNELLSGESTVFVGFMEGMRIQTAGNACVPAFASTEAELGSMIANTTIHETAHMLGLDQGGYDQGGHVAKKDNYMWKSEIQHKTRVTMLYEYTVRQGDTLSGIVQRFKSRQLHPCRRGPTDLTYEIVWEDEENKREGFVAHPTKSGYPQRRRNSPNWIYPGEKVALRDSTFRTEKYRVYFPGWLGRKSFTDTQIETMTDFIAMRLAEGKG